MSDDYLHKEYPKQFDRDAFWQQIKRTVNGKPVSEQDIQMIVDQISGALRFRPGDVLLDLGCGNAALASYLFDSISEYHGVDFSEYLVGVAREFFSIPGKTHFCCGDAVEATLEFPEASRITRVLVYGVISYLSADSVSTLLKTIWSQYSACERIFIGNVPDKTKAADFFQRRNVVDYRLDDPKSPIGVWWSADEFVALGEACGFNVDIMTMPNDFYGAGYRFDVLMTRRV